MASDNTDARRERVRTLWAKSDAAISEILIEEGFAKPARTAAGKRKQLETMRRNVGRDRDWWKKQWRSATKATREDVNETRGEYLARLDSYISDGLSILEDPRMKGTPRVQALSELRQLEQAKAKARGVESVPAEQPDDEDETNAAKNKGLVLSLGNGLSLGTISLDDVKKIYGWEGEEEPEEDSQPKKRKRRK